MKVRLIMAITPSKLPYAANDNDRVNVNGTTDKTTMHFTQFKSSCGNSATTESEANITKATQAANNSRKNKEEMKVLPPRPNARAPISPYVLA